MSTWTRFEGRLDDAEMRAVDAERTRDRVSVWRVLMIIAGALLGLAACWDFLEALIGGGFVSLGWALVLLALAALALVATLGPHQYRKRAARAFWIALLGVIVLMLVLTAVQLAVPALGDLDAICDSLDERERRDCEHKLRIDRVPFLLARLVLTLLACCVPCLICGWSYHRQLHRLEEILSSPPPAASTELNYVNQPPPEAIMYVDGIPATGSLSGPYPGMPMPMPVPMPMPMPVPMGVPVPMGSMPPMGAPLDLQTSAMMAASSPPMPHMGGHGPYPVAPSDPSGMTPMPAPMPVPMPTPLPTPMSPPPLAGVATSGSYYGSDAPQ